MHNRKMAVYFLVFLGNVAVVFANICFVANGVSTNPLYSLVSAVLCATMAGVMIGAWANQGDSNG